MIFLQCQIIVFLIRRMLAIKVAVTIKVGIHKLPKKRFNLKVKLKLKQSKLV